MALKTYLRDKRLWAAIGLICLLVGLRWSGLADQLTLETLRTHRGGLQDLVARHPVGSALAYIAVYVAAVALSLPGAVFLTLGSAGAEWVVRPDARWPEPKGEASAGSAPVETIAPTGSTDPTGCGDAYRAGLVHGITRGMSWEDTGRLASLLGSIKIAHRGTQNHELSPDAVAGAFEAAFGHAIDL